MRGSWGLLDLLQEVTEVAECVVDVVLHVVEVLASSLVFLARAGIEELRAAPAQVGFLSAFRSSRRPSVHSSATLCENATVSVVCLEGPISIIRRVSF